MSILKVCCWRVFRVTCMVPLQLRCRACAGCWPLGGVCGRAGPGVARAPSALGRKAVGAGACHIRPAERPVPRLRSGQRRCSRDCGLLELGPPYFRTRQPLSPQEGKGAPRDRPRIRYLTTGWWPPSS